MARQGKEAVTTQAGEQKDKAKPQELNGMERRAAERHQIETKVIIHKAHGEPVSATAVDISSSGMFVRLERPDSFHLHETVTVEVELRDHADKPFSPWGIGRVVRLEGKRVAIKLAGGSFDESAGVSGDGQARLSTSCRE